MSNSNTIAHAFALNYFLFVLFVFKIISFHVSVNSKMILPLQFKMKCDWGSRTMLFMRKLCGQHRILSLQIQQSYAPNNIIY